MCRWLMAAALALVVLGLSSSPGHARVSIDIGIHFPAPPPLVVVPGNR